MDEKGPVMSRPASMQEEKLPAAGTELVSRCAGGPICRPPLADLRSADALVGGIVHVIGLVQQAMPAEDVMTRRGARACKASVKLGDESRSYFQVALWQSCARRELQVGDVLFLRNIKISTFRGKTEGSSLHSSSVLVALKCRQLAEGKDLVDAVSKFSKEPAFKRRLSAVLEWAVQTQSTLISLAAGGLGAQLQVSAKQRLYSYRNLSGCGMDDRFKGADGKRPRGALLKQGPEGTAIRTVQEGELANQARVMMQREESLWGERTRTTTADKLDYLAKIKDLKSSAMIEVDAWVARFVVPPPRHQHAGAEVCSEGIPWCSEGGPMFKNNRHALHSLIGHGCLSCGREWPEECIRCPCWDPIMPELIKMEGSLAGVHHHTADDGRGFHRACKMGVIYRPFSVHLWDETSTISSLVPNHVAEQMFAGIEAGNLKRSFKSTKTTYHGGGSQKRSDQYEGCAETCEEADAVDREAIVLLLVYALLGKNSKFRFSILYDADRECSPQSPYRLCLQAFSAPPVREGILGPLR